MYDMYVLHKYRENSKYYKYVLKQNNRHKYFYELINHNNKRIKRINKLIRKNPYILININICSFKLINTILDYISVDTDEINIEIFINFNKVLPKILNKIEKNIII